MATPARLLEKYNFSDVQVLGIRELIVAKIQLLIIPELDEIKASMEKFETVSAEIDNLWIKVTDIETGLSEITILKDDIISIREGTDSSIPIIQKLLDTIADTNLNKTDILEIIEDLQGVLLDLKDTWANIGNRNCFEEGYFSDKVSSVLPARDVTFGYVTGGSLGGKSLQIIPGVDFVEPGEVEGTPGTEIVVSITPYKFSTHELMFPGQDTLWCKLGFISKRVDDLGIKLGVLEAGILPDDVVASIQSRWAEVLILINEIKNSGYAPDDFVEWVDSIIELKGAWLDKLKDLIQTEVPDAILNSERFTLANFHDRVNGIDFLTLASTTGALNKFGTVLTAFIDNAFHSILDKKLPGVLNWITPDDMSTELTPPGAYAGFGRNIEDYLIGSDRFMGLIKGELDLTNLNLGTFKSTVCNDNTVWGAIACIKKKIYDFITGERAMLNNFKSRIDLSRSGLLGLKDYYTATMPNTLFDVLFNNKYSATIIITDPDDDEKDRKVFTATGALDIMGKFKEMVEWAQDHSGWYGTFGSKPWYISWNEALRKSRDAINIMKDQAKSDLYSGPGSIYNNLLGEKGTFDTEITELGDISADFTTQLAGLPSVTEWSGYT